jgi:hypothetical protein
MSLGVWKDFGISGAVCVHSILLPNEKLLCVERPHQAPYAANPYTNAELATEIDLKSTNEVKFTVVPIDNNPFCGGHSQRADGTIGFFGGDKTGWLQMDGSILEVEGHFGSRTYTPCTSEECTTGSWTQNTELTTARWYPSVATLYDGTEIIVGGVTGNLDLSAPEGNNPTYEYHPPREQNEYNALNGLLDWCFPYCLYPVVLQLPAGKVFVMAANRSVIIDHKSNTVTQPFDALNAPDHMPWIYPNTPTYTVLPMTIKNNFRFVIQICGGNETGEGGLKTSAQCWQLAPEEKGAKWTRAADMPHARVMPDSVILPDGKVLVLNGAGWGNAGGNAGYHLNADNPVLAADIFDPEATEGSQWQTLSSATKQRIYHSEAILVHSGHVVTAGSEMLNIVDKGRPECYPGVDGNSGGSCTDPFGYMMEQFSPPYLANVATKPRPEIAEAPAVVEYSTEFSFEVKGSAGGIKRVTFIRYSAVTHSTNNDQRFIELIITKKQGSTITVKAPWNSAMCPPGNWLLWALDADGVPSESKTVRLKLVKDQEMSFDLLPAKFDPVEAVKTASGNETVNGTSIIAIVIVVMTVAVFILVGLYHINKPLKVALK